MTSANGTAARRGRGEGSLTELPNGRYMGRVTTGPGERRVVYGNTKAETLSKMRAAMAKAERGEQPTDARVTVETFLKEWLEGPAKARLRGTTYRSYDHYVNAHLIPGLGKHRLARLRPEHVDVFLANKGKGKKPEGGLSPRTCQYMRAILRSALAWAEKRGRVARNAAALADAPRVERREIQPLTPAQARILVDAASGDRLGPLFVAALDTGLRQGELLGLRWQDIDLAKRTLRVVQARQHVKGPAQFGPPKSAAGRRSVTFTATTAGFLGKQQSQQRKDRLRQGKNWHDLDLVFASPTGAPLDGPTVTHRFQRFLEQNDLPRQRFHDLRHASASFLLAQGMPVKAIAERLGHSQITLTLSTYAHLADELQGQAATLMDGVLTGKRRRSRSAS